MNVGDSTRITYLPNGDCEIVVHRDGVELSKKLDKAKMPVPEGNIHFYDVDKDDTSAWGLWAKARNKLADKAVSLRGKNKK